jgi:hypothetical protein
MPPRPSSRSRRYRPIRSVVATAPLVLAVPVPVAVLFLRRRTGRDPGEKPVGAARERLLVSSRNPSRLGDNVVEELGGSVVSRASLKGRHGVRVRGQPLSHGSRNPRRRLRTWRGPAATARERERDAKCHEPSAPPAHPATPFRGSPPGFARQGRRRGERRPARRRSPAATRRRAGLRRAAARPSPG